MPSAGLPQTTHAIILKDAVTLLATKSKKWNRIQEAQTGMCQWSASTFENCSLLISCHGQARDRVTGSDWADRLAGKATVTSSLCLARSKVMRSLRHYLQEQSQGHLTINCMEEWSVERGCIWYLPRKDERRPLSIRQTLAILGDFWEGGEHIFMEFSEHTEYIYATLNSL